MQQTCWIFQCYCRQQVVPAGLWRFEGREGHYPKHLGVKLHHPTELLRCELYLIVALAQAPPMGLYLFILVFSFEFQTFGVSGCSRGEWFTPWAPTRIFQADVYDMGFTPTTTSTTTVVFSMVQISPSVSFLQEPKWTYQICRFCFFLRFWMASWVRDGSGIAALQLGNKWLSGSWTSTSWSCVHCISASFHLGGWRDACGISIHVFASRS